MSYGIGSTPPPAATALLDPPSPPGYTTPNRPTAPPPHRPTDTPRLYTRLEDSPLGHCYTIVPDMCRDAQDAPGSRWVPA